MLRTDKKEKHFFQLHNISPTLDYTDSSQLAFTYPAIFTEKFRYARESKASPGKKFICSIRNESFDVSGRLVNDIYLLLTSVDVAYTLSHTHTDTHTHTCEEGVIRFACQKVFDGPRRCLPPLNPLSDLARACAGSSPFFQNISTYVWYARIRTHRHTHTSICWEPLSLKLVELLYLFESETRASWCVFLFMWGEGEGCVGTTDMILYFGQSAEKSCGLWNFGDAFVRRRFCVT